MHDIKQPSWAMHTSIASQAVLQNVPNDVKIKKLMQHQPRILIPAEIREFLQFDEELKNTDLCQKQWSFGQTYIQFGDVMVMSTMIRHTIGILKFLRQMNAQPLRVLTPPS